jgi:hypothetical protein
LIKLSALPIEGDKVKILRKTDYIIKNISFSVKSTSPIDF